MGSTGNLPVPPGHWPDGTGGNGAIGNKPLFHDVRELLDEEERLLQFMTTQEGKFRVRDGVVVFADTRSADAFDEHVNRIASLGEAMTKRMAARRKSLLQKTHELEQIPR